MNKKLIKLGAVAAAGVLALSLAACGEADPEGGGTTESITFWGATTQYNTDYYSELVKSYNEGQGKIDGVTVRYSPKGADYSTNLTGILNGRNAPNVCMIGDKYFKPLAAQGLLTDLTPFLADESLTTKDAEGNPYLDLDNIYSQDVYRFRYDRANNTAGSEDSPLYALSNGTPVTGIIYNKGYFEDANIHIISVAEEDLDAYNAAHGTSYKPHGYAEYLPAATPEAGLATSSNLAGDTVVKVFNNRIPLNWTELIALSRYFTKAYRADSPSDYGFLSEWWFSYGWSVGGDCIKWDESASAYQFTLGDTNANWKVTKAVTVNGVSYAAGDILEYNAAKYVNGHETEFAGAVADGTLVELPSQYEAFREFCSLYPKKGKEVDTLGKLGYGVAPNPSTLGNTGRTAYFTSGKVAILCAMMEEVPTLLAGTSVDWDLAPAWQYRTFEGGDTDGELNGERGAIKIIGKEYGGTVYGGELREVNDVPVVGAKASASINRGFAISAVSSDSKKAAAWKFLQYLAGTEGQRILSKSYEMIPNQIDYTGSDEYLNSLDGKNLWAFVEAASYASIGDWSYLENQSWVDHWADILNTDVRNGNMNLDAFFNEVTNRANQDLQGYTVRLMRR